MFAKKTEDQAAQDTIKKSTTNLVLDENKIPHDAKTKKSQDS